MLPFITLLGTTVFVTYASYLVYTLWDNQRRFAKASRDHGCKPVPTVSSWDPILGIDTFSTVIKSHLAGRRSELYKNLHIKYGPTFSMKLLGVSEIQTAHPENIQAICTSSFNDFGVNPMRGNIGAPFLDRGIFTEDGEFWKHSRALVRPTFSKAEIANLGGFERHVARYLALLPKDGSTIDLLPLTKKLVSL
jgi:cytochrome P450